MVKVFDLTTEKIIDITTDEWLRFLEVEERILDPVTFLPTYISNWREGINFTNIKVELGENTICS